MAPGATTISGSYKMTQAGFTAAEAFIEARITSTTSGAQVFIIPAANGLEFFVGVTEGLR